MKGSAPVEVMLPFIFGVLLALVIFFTFVFPSLMRIIYGTCWGNTDSMLADITSSIDRLGVQQSVMKTLTLGSCISKLVFSNKADLKAQDGGACPPDYQSMIVISPNFQGLEKVEKEAKGVKTKCKQIPFKSETGIQAYARLSPGILVLDGPGNENSATSYCVKITKTSRNELSLELVKEGC